MRLAKQLRARATYANVTSTLALVLALGAGSAFAAGQLAPKSVGEKQLRHGAVTPDKLRKNAVTAPKIAALAVKEGKLADGSVTGPKLAKGAVGAANIVPGAVTGEKIAAGAVNGEKVDEATLSQVPSSAHADSATSAESANPVAFAKVTADAAVDIALSKGIGPADVHPGAESGTYCVSAPGLSPRGAQVTPQGAGAPQGVTAYVTIGGAGSCPAPQVEVQMRTAAGLVKAAFYIALYR